MTATKRQISMINTRLKRDRDLNAKLDSVQNDMDSMELVNRRTDTWDYTARAKRSIDSLHRKLAANEAEIGELVADLTEQEFLDIVVDLGFCPDGWGQDETGYDHLFLMEEEEEEEETQEEPQPTISSLQAIINAPTADDGLVIHATPYGYSDYHAGFYFSNYDEYEQRKNATQQLGLMTGDSGDFEHELQLIDAPDGIEQSTLDSLCIRELESFFTLVDEYEALNELEQVAISYLMFDRHCSLKEAMEKRDDVYIVEGTALDYSYEFIDECYSDMPEFFLSYFNYEAFTRDMELNGDWREHRYNGEDYTILNGNDV